MILFFYGENSFTARAKINELIERFKKSNSSDFGIERIDGESVVPEQVVSALCAVPFLANARLVIIEDLSINKPACELVLQQLASIPDSTVAVFYESKVDKRSNWFKTLIKTAKSQEFNTLSVSNLKPWISKVVDQAGGSIDSKTTQLLIDYVGTDQWRLYNEIQKLADYDKNITQDTIKKLVEPGFEHTIFDLVEALGKSNVRQALSLYRGLRSQRIQPLYVLAMFGWQLRNLLLIKAAGQKSQLAIAKEASISPYVVGKASSAAKDIELDNIKLAYRLVIQADYDIKTSTNDPDIIIEQLIIDISQTLKA